MKQATALTQKKKTCDNIARKGEKRHQTDIRQREIATYRTIWPKGRLFQKMSSLHGHV